MPALHITTIRAGLGNLHKSTSGRMVLYVGMCALLILLYYWARLLEDIPDKLLSSRRVLTNKTNWIAIDPVDSFNHLSNNLGLAYMYIMLHCEYSGIPLM